jgi:hypothetical protein
LSRLNLLSYASKLIEPGLIRGAMVMTVRPDGGMSYTVEDSGRKWQLVSNESADGEPSGGQW